MASQPLGSDRRDERSALDAPRLGAALDSLLEQLAVRVVDEIERRGLSGAAAERDGSPPADEPEVYTAAEAARFLRIGVNRLRDLLKSGAIESMERRPGERRWHVSRAALQRYVQQQEGRGGLRVVDDAAPPRGRGRRRSAGDG